LILIFFYNKPWAIKVAHGFFFEIYALDFRKKSSPLLVGGIGKRGNSSLLVGVSYEKEV
jgi:hypothetical protein